MGLHWCRKECCCKQNQRAWWKINKRETITDRKTRGKNIQNIFFFMFEENREERCDQKCSARRYLWRGNFLIGSNGCDGIKPSADGYRITQNDSIAAAIIDNCSLNKKIQWNNNNKRRVKMKNDTAFLWLNCSGRKGRNKESVNVIYTCLYICT